MRTNYGLYLQSILSVDTVQTRPDIYPQDQFNILTFLLHLYIFFKKHTPRPPPKKKKKSQPGILGPSYYTTEVLCSWAWGKYQRDRNTV